MLDVVYIVSHGFAARMVMQTDLLLKLRRAGLSVGVIASDASDQTLAAYCTKNDVRLFEFKGDHSFWKENHIFKRRYYLEDLRSNPALWEKHVHAVRYNKARNPVRWLRPHYYGLIHRLVPRFPSLRETFRMEEQKRLHSDKAVALLSEIAPRRLVSTYPVNFDEASLLYNARAVPGTERWIHLLSWDNITCKGRFPETADFYLAWGPTMRDELKEYYEATDDCIWMVGVPHFDLHVRVRENPEYAGYVAALGLDPGKPYLFFAMSSPRFAPHEIDIVEWLAARIAAGDFGALQLIVRPHPQNVTGNLSDQTWLPRLRNLSRFSSVGVSFPSLNESGLRWSMTDDDMRVIANLITGSSVVLNSGSTVSIDALFHDKPVLLTSFDGGKRLEYWRSARRLIDYPHLAKLVSSGGALPVYTYSELEAQIRKYAADPHASRAERRAALARQCADTVGHATERTVAVLLSANASNTTESVRPVSSR